MADLWAGAVGSFSGINVYGSYYLERGRFYMGMDLAVGGRSVFKGLGLLRGVAYKAPGVERGYLVHQEGSSCELLDAATGKLVWVAADRAVEVEERYRSEAVI